MMNHLPPWVDHLSELMEEFVELQSPGTIEWRWNAREEQLVVAPEVLEIVGGADDGEVVFPFFLVHLRELSEEFDGPPSIEWTTMHDELWVSGEIGGEEVFLIFRKEPFADSVPVQQLENGKSLRQKEEE